MEKYGFNLQRLNDIHTINFNTDTMDNLFYKN